MSYINILLPVYNEQFRLNKGVKGIISFLDHEKENDYEITIIDNASTDDTTDIAKKLCCDYQQVHFLQLKEKGVGVAFRAGIKANDAQVVGYMDIDLSTDIKHLNDVLNIFRLRQEVDIVNASRWNKKSDTKGRKWYRNITSHGLTLLLKIFLHMKASDAICGFKFYKKEIAEQLIDEAGQSDNGWFYIIELLLRAERDGMQIYELPVRWEDDHNSTVKVWKTIKDYLFHIIRLRQEFKEEKKRR